MSAPSSRGLWTAVGVLLAPAILVPLLVPLYDSEGPTLLGFPFYFWFQFLLIPLAAGLTVTAFVVANKADRIDREARGTTTGPTPGGPR